METFTCSDCNKVYSSGSNLNRHVRSSCTNSKKQICEHCKTPIVKRPDKIANHLKICKPAIEALATSSRDKAMTAATAEYDKMVVNNTDKSFHHNTINNNFNITLQSGDWIKENLVYLSGEELQELSNKKLQGLIDSKVIATVQTQDEAITVLGQILPGVVLCVGKDNQLMLYRVSNDHHVQHKINENNPIVENIAKGLLPGIDATGVNTHNIKRVIRDGMKASRNEYHPRVELGSRGTPAVLKKIVWPDDPNEEKVVIAKNYEPESASSESESDSDYEEPQIYQYGDDRRKPMRLSL